MARNDRSAEQGTTKPTATKRRFGRRGTAAGATALPKKPLRVAQIRAAYKLTRKADPMLPWIMLGIGFLVFAIMLSLGFLVGHPIYLGILGLTLGLLAATVIFGRRAERAAYQQIEGQPGAAAAALNSLRRGWTVTPAVP